MLRFIGENKGVQGRWLPHYFTPSHVVHQRLLLQFLSAPEDGRKKRSETCTVLPADTNKHTAKLHHVGSLYILTYDARKLKHKI